MAFTKLDDKTSRNAFEMLAKEYPDAKYYLNFKTPIQLVVAAIMSAQTHDTVVNAVTPELFGKYKSAEDFAKADPQELTNSIRRVTFAGNKAKNIIKTCRSIVDDYGGKVPDKMEQLVELPGIGRKTANTILINAYGIVQGIPVDTWVIKLTHRIGMSDKSDPDEIEQDLMKLLDKKYWGKAAYIFKSHGHAICKSQVPLCSKCILNKICPKNDVKKSA